MRNQSAMPNFEGSSRSFWERLFHMSNAGREMRPLIQFVCDASQSATVGSRDRAEETVGKREY